MPPMDMGDPNAMMPPQGDPNAMPPMADPNMPMQDPNMMGGGAESEFDTNFDAGVEADENTDPKKFIQQLTGKLSQSLRKYNSELPQPDVDLNKYVAGMINKQATEGLTEDDVEEIISKIQVDDSQPMEQDPNAMMPPQGDPNMDAQQGQQPMPQQPPMQPNESRQRRLINLDEIIDEITGSSSEKKDDNVKDDENKPNSPFTSPRFK